MAIPSMRYRSDESASDAASSPALHIHSDNTAQTTAIAKSEAQPSLVGYWPAALCFAFISFMSSFGITAVYGVKSGVSEKTSASDRLK